MRRAIAVWSTLFLVAAASSKVAAQQSVYLVVDSVKGDQPAPHDGEFRLNSFAYASTNATSITSVSGGMSAGKASFGPVQVAMHFTPGSIAAFQRLLAMGRRVPSVEVRLYNSGRLYAKTVFENAFVTSVKTEGSDDINQEIEFVYGRIKWFAADASGTIASSPTGCWDLTQNSSRC